MAFLKFRADKLFDGYRMYDDSHVLITTDDGRVEEIVPLVEAGTDIRQLNGIISPGFINSHVHLELSHMKGAVPEKTGLADFVFRIVTNRHKSQDEILAAIETAENEMLEEGIVAAGDICNNALTIPQKLKGRIWYHNFIEASGFNPSIAEERFQRSVGFFAAYSKLYSIPTESNSITPHAPYSVSEELWEKIIHFPGNHLFSIHNQEAEEEDQWFRNKTGQMSSLYEKMKMDTSFFHPSGKSSLQTYLPKFMANQAVILVHNVHTSEEDVQFAMNTGRSLYWCLCPNANWYINRKLPDIPMLRNNECHIVLGTDSLASNHRLSILSEINMVLKHFPDLALATLLQWATVNGAIALHIDALYGSFEKGKKPGVLQISAGLDTVQRLV
jgi:cytosine/adenosine deaminase-related metal-dependent hydrolase